MNQEKKCFLLLSTKYKHNLKNSGIKLFQGLLTTSLNSILIWGHVQNISSLTVAMS